MSSMQTAPPLLAPKRMVELEVDGQAVRVFEGQTILDAVRKLGVDTPTLCYGETLRPANGDERRQSGGEVRVADDDHIGGLLRQV